MQWFPSDLFFLISQLIFVLLLWHPGLDEGVEELVWLQQRIRTNSDRWEHLQTCSRAVEEAGGTHAEPSRSCQGGMLFHQSCKHSLHQNQAGRQQTTCMLAMKQQDKGYCLQGKASQKLGHSFVSNLTDHGAIPILLDTRSRSTTLCLPAFNMLVQQLVKTPNLWFIQFLAS